MRDKSRYTQDEWDWCLRYKGATGFDPMMDEFEAERTSFKDCAFESLRWFEDWAAEAYNSAQRGVYDFV